MSLSIGIIGLPNVGKSTLFNALLQRQTALVASYPFATIEPNVGMVDVPDERLSRLKQIVVSDESQKPKSSQKPVTTTPAVVKFHDIAGLVKGANKGEGLGNEFLGHIRTVDVLAHVVRFFKDENVETPGSQSPEEDIKTINTELALADLNIIEKLLSGFSTELRTTKSKEDKANHELLLQVKETLDSGDFSETQSFTNKLTNEQKIYLKSFGILSFRPVIYIYNVSESELGNNSTQIMQRDHEYSLNICAKLESEIVNFTEKSEKEQILCEYGLKESGLDKLIKIGYELLDLETFFTTRSNELRAWTVRQNSTAKQAAGVIHTDFERGFISCDVINFDQLDKIGSLKTAKEQGKVRQEGKEYVVKDGDVIDFKFSV